MQVEPLALMAAQDTISPQSGAESEKCNLCSPCMLEEVYWNKERTKEKSREVSVKAPELSARDAGNAALSV